MTIKLHLGCGNVNIYGYTNIDCRYQPGVDEVSNIGILRGYKPDSVVEIYACHCLDHFSRWDYPRVLGRWLELLVDGGTLKLSVIDFHAIVELYHSGSPLEDLIGCLTAAQDYESNVRRMHWNFTSLDRDLKDAGFSRISRVHSHFNPGDCSAATIRSVPISLNVKAIK